MRSGCLRLVFVVGAAVASALLVAAGAFLLVFSFFVRGAALDLRTVLAAVVVPLALYFFIQVGRSVLRDLGEGRRRSGSEEDEDPR